MEKIFSSQDITLVSFYQAMLEDNGIASIIKNYYLSGGVGDLPANACVPELWVLDDNQAQAARELLRGKTGAPWQCDCGEQMAAQFSQCWKCGRVREK
ncbi:hypothetical protein AQUSIP_09220 [Aquicella siphonis]|uniref:DUF2007 domain-containing protein n=1 Tax=Aquicella siphonis TaxID=254247 RepID=A0A5E4PGM6_9COXI|nr:DUF2007 domain-containing protein [Aquicella siphonis]VVC75632.1 hypothetical protein AQUSIP_09220 [Aquicella siphonis]